MLRQKSLRGREPACAFLPSLTKKILRYLVQFIPWQSLCSQKYTPEQILHITSQEWGVEAMHWSLDNTLGEDKCTIASKSKLIASNIVRKIALFYISSLIKIYHIKNTVRGHMKFLSFNPQMLIN
jgi:hypothetical protein